MSAARLLAAALLLAGIGVGSLVDRATLPSPARVDGYVMLAGDFHVHAFGDGTLTPWALRREAARRGLHVIAVTNHNFVAPAQLVRRLTQGSNVPLILAGMELTSRNYHLIAAGVTGAVDWDQSAVAAIAAIHEQGGVAIAAHPVAVYWQGLDAAAIRALDGVEAAHPLMAFDVDEARELGEFHRRARGIKPQLAAIGSSDYHGSHMLGACRTYLLASEVSEAAVLDAIRDGRTVAEDVQGELHGDARWVALVRAARVLPSRANDDAWPVVSVICAWLGLLGLVVLGGQRHGRAI